MPESFVPRPRGSRALGTRLAQLNESERIFSHVNNVSTGCIKKAIEIWSALVRSLYNLQKSFFYSRKDQAFNFRMLQFL